MRIPKLTFTALIVFFFLPLSLFAQEEGGLSLVTSPLPVSIITEPGKTITTELKVKNDGLETEELQVRLMKFRAYEDSGKPALEEPDGTEEFLKWVTISESRFTLASNEWKTVPVTFTPPESASFGYYYAFVFSRAQENTGNPDGRTTLAGGNGVLVLLEVAVPNAKKEIILQSFDTNRSIYEFLPVSFSARLKNTGNVHTAPRGNIFITKKGKEVALLEVNIEKGNILPGSERVFESIWQDGFIRFIPKKENGAVLRDKEGSVDMKLEWNWADAEKLRFGKYTAKLVLVYDNGVRDIPLEEEVTFWVLPWRIMLAGVFVALFFLVGIKGTITSFLRRFQK